MKINFKNTEQGEKRVRLTPKDGAEGVLPFNEVNPTVQQLEDGSITFCLGKMLFSCDGATNTSGLVEIEGEVDIIQNGVIVAEGVNAADLATIMDGTSGVKFEKFETTFDLAPYGHLDVTPQLEPMEITDRYDSPYFRIEAPENVNTGMGLRLKVSSVYPDEDYVNGRSPTGNVEIILPDRIPLDVIDQNGYPPRPAHDGLYVAYETQTVTLPFATIRVYAYRNIRTQRWGWMISASTYEGRDQDIYFNISEMGSNISIPVNPANGIMVIPNDNLLDQHNIFIGVFAGNPEIIQEGEPPPPEPLPPELIPPVGVSDWIALSKFGLHQIYVNNVLLPTGRSSYGYPPSRNDQNVQIMLEVLRLNYNIRGMKRLNVAASENYDVLLVNETLEPIHIKLVRSGWDTIHTVETHPDNTNDSFNRVDSETVEFWLGAAFEEASFENPVTGDWTDNYFSVKGKSNSTETYSTFKDYCVMFIDGRVVTEDIALYTKGLPTAASMDDPQYRTPMDWLVDDGRVLGRIPNFTYETVTGIPNKTIYENMTNEPVEVVYYFPLGVPSYIQVGMNTTTSVGERTIKITVAPRKLVVDINPLPSSIPANSIDRASINLRHEFRKKYQPWMNSGLEVEFNIRRNLTPRCNANLSFYGNGFGYAPSCDPYGTPGVSDNDPRHKVSAIFVGSVPSIYADTGLEVDWHYNYLARDVGYIRDKWELGNVINVNVYSTIYGLGGAGGFHRTPATGAEWQLSGGKGHPPVSNFDSINNVTLTISVYDTGKYISGGGGGSSQPIGVMIAESRQRMNTAQGWGPWSPWASGGEWRKCPNSGGGGGIPNGMDGCFRIAWNLPPEPQYLKAYYPGKQNITNGTAPNYGDPEALPFTVTRWIKLEPVYPNFNQRTKGAQPGLDWQDNVDKTAVWTVPEWQSKNAGDYGTYEIYTRAYMVLTPGITQEGGKAGILVNGPCTSIRMRPNAVVLGDETGAPPFIDF